MNQSSNDTSSQAFPIKITRHLNGHVTASAPTIPGITPVTAVSAHTAINALKRVINTAIDSGKVKR